MQTSSWSSAVHQFPRFWSSCIRFCPGTGKCMQVFTCNVGVRCLHHCNFKLNVQSLGFCYATDHNVSLSENDVCSWERACNVSTLLKNLYKDVRNLKKQTPVKKANEEAHNHKFILALFQRHCQKLNKAKHGTTSPHKHRLLWNIVTVQNCVLIFVLYIKRQPT